MILNIIIVLCYLVVLTLVIGILTDVVDYISFNIKERISKRLDSNNEVERYKRYLERRKEDYDRKDDSDGR